MFCRLVSAVAATAVVATVRGRKASFSTMTPRGGACGFHPTPMLLILLQQPPTVAPPSSGGAGSGRPKLERLTEETEFTVSAADAYFELAVELQRDGRHEEALPLYRKDAEIRQRLAEKGQPTTIIERIAGLQAQGKKEGTDAELDELIGKAEKNGGEAARTGLEHTYLGMASAHFALGNAVAAQQCNEKAIEIMTRKLKIVDGTGAEPADVFGTDLQTALLVLASMHASAAKAFAMEERFDQCYPHFESGIEACDRIKSLLGEDRLCNRDDRIAGEYVALKAHVLNGRGTVLSCEGRHSEALKAHEAALATLDEFLRLQPKDKLSEGFITSEAYLRGMAADTQGMVGRVLATGLNKPADAIGPLKSAIAFFDEQLASENKKKKQQSGSDDNYNDNDVGDLVMTMASMLDKLGVCYFRVGQVDDAAASLDKAIATYTDKYGVEVMQGGAESRRAPPEVVAALLSLAANKLTVMEQVGQLQRGIDFLRAAYDALSPILFDLQDRVEEVQSQTVKGVSSPPNATIKQQGSSSSNATAAEGEGERREERALIPAILDAQLSLALGACRSKDFSTAMKYATVSLDYFETPQARTVRGLVLFERDGNKEAALKELKRAKEMDPRNPEVLHHLRTVEAAGSPS